MQFNLSTLMLLAPAVAFGCTGWKLAQWMIGEGAWVEPLVYTLLVASLGLMIALAVLGGRRVAAWCVLGFIVNVTIVLLKFGPPPPSSIWLVPLLGAPLGLFFGSLRFAVETSRPLAIRHGFLLPSCLMMGWFLAVFFHG
jgi:hypothetical protein